jgi:hypothetical protein
MAKGTVGKGTKGTKSARGGKGAKAGNAAVVDAGPTKQDIEPLNPVFAWFEGGDVLQFGELCSHCPDAVREECKNWSRDTLAGLKTSEPRLSHDCVYFIKWRDMDFTREMVSKDDEAEGEKDIGACPSCGGKGLRQAARVASEYGTRQNPRATFLEWCPCGHFRTVKKEFFGDREHCVFCGKKTAGAGTTVFRGALFHLDCVLRLRFFITMSEMLGVAQQYMKSGKPLSNEDSKTALAKTLETVRAFKLTGNGNVIGINRVIHWLEGDQPVVSERTVLRSRQALLEHLQATFAGDSERAVGVHILEDAYVVYDNAAAVRWITRGAYRPLRSVKEFIDNYLDLASAGKWDELDQKHLIPEIADGKCALCGAVSRSHRIATGEDDHVVYSCHHCWIGRAGK